MSFKSRLRIKLSVLLGAILWACSSPSQISREKITIGVVGYDTEVKAVGKYEPLQSYLAGQINSIVELEPAYNELQALEQIQRQRWSLVFAPPGIAAIAMSDEQYIPIFPLERVGSRERSLLIVRKDSQIEDLADLSQKKIALGQLGSATGYYLPLYDLYGLTLAEVIFAPTPKEILQLLEEEKVDAGALSEDEFQTYRSSFPTEFKVLRKSRFIPSGLVILSPLVDRNQQENISNAMKNAPASIVSDAGYIIEDQIPDYEEFIKLIKKVQPLEEKVRQTPAILNIDK